MIPIVVMCGGRGLRLHPLTENRPKPMLKVGGRPILEQIIDGFSGQGFKKFWLCINYKGDLIEKHFGNGESRGIKVRYLHETEPLGTAGALGLLPKPDTPFIVSNGDVLAKVNYGNLMEFHARSGAGLTMCVALHQYQVPYGVAEIGEDRLTDLKEKPIESWAVNAGIYVLEPSVLDKAVPLGYLDMPDLIKRVESVAVYQIEGFWCDTGTFQDLTRANQAWEP